MVRMRIFQSLRFSQIHGTAELVAAMGLKYREAVPGFFSRVPVGIGRRPRRTAGRRVPEVLERQGVTDFLKGAVERGPHSSQAPSKQSWPALQARLQAPQCVTLLESSMHVPPQSVSSGAQRSRS